MPAEARPVRVVRQGRMHALVAPDLDVVHVIGPDGDPDRLLTSPRCELKKFQQKVVVGRIETARGWVYVKRYNVHALRVLVGSLFRRSPARAAFENAERLAAEGVGVPRALAAVEYRRVGLVVRSFFVTDEVAGAVTADVAWQAVLALEPPAARRHARRRFVRALGRFFAELHARGVYHRDLKDVNVLVRDPSGTPTFVLLDLERVAIGAVVSTPRRVRNLMQLARTLGLAATRTDRLRWLAAYRGDAGRRDRRVWVERTLRAQRRKERGRRPVAPARGPTITCTIVCQDEAAQIAHALDSVAWCDEIVVVDGGSRDATPEIARARFARVLHNPWPGYRAQKQLALQASTGEWVLNLDADERVSDELANEIRAALRATPGDVDAYAIPRLVSYLGRWWYRGGWYPRRVVRLVRRTRCTWGGTDPHDRAEVVGRVRALRAPIFHYTYDDVSDHLRTVAKLTAVAAAQVPAGRRVGAGRLAAEPGWRFFRAYVLKGGFREGLPGFFMAATDAFYVFLRWARVWDRTRRSC
jgi:tRNA A-37 threonylcarbamoyl transferase component Bud32